MKICTICKNNKTEDSFYKDKRKKDGLYSSCKECSTIYSKTWIKNNKEKRNENSKLWARKNREKVNLTNKKWREQNKEKLKDIYKNYKKRNPEKCKARYLLNLAVKKGIIIKPDKCEICLTKASGYKLRADHYKGYEKENKLIVRWICSTCDGKQFRK